MVVPFHGLLITVSDGTRFQKPKPHAQETQFALERQVADKIHIGEPQDLSDVYQM